MAPIFLTVLTALMVQFPILILCVLTCFRDVEEPNIMNSDLSSFNELIHIHPTSQFIDTLFHSCKHIIFIYTWFEGAVELRIICITVNWYIEGPNERCYGRTVVGEQIRSKNGALGHTARERNQRGLGAWNDNSLGAIYQVWFQPLVCCIHNAKLRFNSIQKCLMMDSIECGREIK